MQALLKEQFDFIHNIPLPEDVKDRQRLLEAHRLYVKYTTIPLLVEAIKKANPDMTWAQAYVQLQEFHIEYMGQFFTGSEATYSTNLNPEKTFVSKQTPVGKFLNAYHRFKAGLAAWREYSFKQKTADGFETERLRLYLHASPVPYGKDEFTERNTWTQNNFRELLGATDEKPLTEIRLLTPIDLGKKHFTKLSDYDQLLEMAIAVEVLKKEGKDILLFNYGTNIARRLARQLQSLLNTRSMTNLFYVVLGQLGSKENANIHIPHESLLGQLPPGANEKITKKLFTQALLKQNKGHRAAWTQQVAALNSINENELTEDQKQIRSLALEIVGLISRNRWASEENKFKIQAALTELNCLLDRTVAIGCNDAKDRAGEQIAMLEARQIAKETGCDVNKALVKEILEKSTPEKVASQISMPKLALGRDTKDHPEQRSAGIFKRIYTMRQLRKFEAKDRWDKRKQNMRERIEQCWPTSRPLYNLILFIIEWLADRNDPLMQKKSKKEAAREERRESPVPLRVVEVNKAPPARTPGIPPEDVEEVLKVLSRKVKPGEEIPPEKSGTPPIAGH